MSSTDGESSSPVKSSKMERGPDRLDMVDKVIPESNDWDAKTKHEIDDPWRVAGLRNISEVIPSVDHQQEKIDSWLDDYLKNKTSEEAKSRQDIFSTVKSLFGGGGDEDEKYSTMKMALGATDDD